MQANEAKEKEEQDRPRLEQEHKAAEALALQANEAKEKEEQDRPRLEQEHKEAEAEALALQPYVPFFLQIKTDNLQDTLEKDYITYQYSETLNCSASRFGYDGSFRVPGFIF